VKEIAGSVSASAAAKHVKTPIKKIAINIQITKAGYSVNINFMSRGSNFRPILVRRRWICLKLDFLKGRFQKELNLIFRHGVGCAEVADCLHVLTGQIKLTTIMVRQSLSLPPKAVLCRPGLRS
jgi:hypothetical protein